MKIGQHRRAATTLAGLLLAAALPARADYGMNLVRGVTETSHTAFDLHMISLWGCVAIGVVVFGAMFYALFAFRKSRGAVAANFHENTTVEVVWTIIPIIILISMAVPATLSLIDLEDTSDAELTVKVTGYQWRWQYEYIDQGVSFFSNLASSSRDATKGDPHSVEHYLLDVDNRVVLPVNTRVRFVFTSNDVIHSWWVPALGWKQDTVPGFINDAWTSIPEPGVYRGQCAELCGKDHGFMPIVVEAKTREDYDAWLVAKKAETEAAASGADRDWTPAGLPVAGRQQDHDRGHRRARRYRHERQGRDGHAGVRRAVERRRPGGRDHVRAQRFRQHHGRPGAAVGHQGGALIRSPCR